MKQKDTNAERLDDALIRIARELLVLASNARQWERIMRNFEKDPPINLDQICWPKRTPDKPTASWVEPPVITLSRWHETETTKMLTRLAGKLLVAASNVEDVIAVADVAGDKFDKLYWPIGTRDRLTSECIRTPQDVLKRWEANQAAAKRAKSGTSEEKE